LCTASRKSWRTAFGGLPSEKRPQHSDHHHHHFGHCGAGFFIGVFYRVTDSLEWQVWTGGFLVSLERT
jgi:hypothetical protein